VGGDSSIQMREVPVSRVILVAKSRFFILPLSSTSHCPSALPGESEEGNANTQAREVPVSRVILVAKSRFFRKMLTGGFREASSWSKVDIFLEADGKGRTVLKDQMWLFLHGRSASCLEELAEIFVVTARVKSDELCFFPGS